jgi:hypothetical protein
MANTVRKDDVELQKFKAKKLARSLIRMKFSLMAEDVLNEYIPAIDDAVQDALDTGSDWVFEVRALIDDALGIKQLGRS